MSHSLGPWTIEPNPYEMVVRGADGWVILEVGLADTDKANVRLIAAAPDMLEALRRVVTSEMLNKADDLVCRAAIAKAEGRAEG